MWDLAILLKVPDAGVVHPIYTPPPEVTPVGTIWTPGRSRPEALALVCQGRSTHQDWSWGDMSQVLEPSVGWLWVTLRHVVYSLGGTEPIPPQGYLLLTSSSLFFLSFSLSHLFTFFSQETMPILVLPPAPGGISTKTLSAAWEQEPLYPLTQWPWPSSACAAVSIFNAQLGGASERPGCCPSNQWFYTMRELFLFGSEFCEFLKKCFNVVVLKFLCIYLVGFFWVHWVFFATHGLSLAAGSKGYSVVVASKGYSLIAVSELLILMVLMLGSSGSRALRLQ